MSGGEQVVWAKPIEEVLLDKFWSKPCGGPIKPCGKISRMYRPTIILGERVGI